MTRQDITDACERIRDTVARFGADQDNRTFWHWDRAFWYATRALAKLGQMPFADCDDQIKQATQAIERHS